MSLLASLYGEVVVPPSVARELRSAPDLHANFDWSVLRIVSPESTERVQELRSQLDVGESEAIVVALELHADLLLVGERTGRSVAQRLGLNRTGLLGVLLEAKARDLIASVMPEVDRLVRQTSFWVSPEIQEEVRRLADE